MKTKSAFPLGTQQYSIHELLPEDSELIQELFDKCLDYMLLVDGRPAVDNSGSAAFTEIPPGSSLNDHFIFGILDQQNTLAGLLDAIQNYPDEHSWWIGLLLIAPESRSQGLGRLVVKGFEDFIRSGNGQVIMLGVVEENQRAYEFWKGMGFEFISRTGPSLYGEKTHTIIIMSKTVVEKE